MFVVGSNNGLDNVLSPESHLLVLGPPRCGKTRNVVIPNILSSNCSTVVTSTKPDILLATARKCSDRGRIWVFDPFRSIPDEMIDTFAGTRLRFSPLQSISDFRTGILLARSMVRSSSELSLERGSFWQERAEATLAPVFLAAKLGSWTMDDVMELIETKEVEPALSLLVSRGEKEAARTLGSVLASADKERSGILSNAAGILGGYRSPQVIEQASTPNFDPEKFIKSKDTLFVIAPSNEQEVLAPVVVSLLWSIRDAAYRVSALKTHENGYVKPNPQVKLILDEMANIAPIHDLASVLSEGASQGVLLLGVLQDLSQARARWPGSSDGFMTLFANAMLFPGVSDVRTLGEFSQLSGEKTVMLPSVGPPSTLFGPERISHSGQIRPALSISQLNRQVPNQALLYSSKKGFSRVAFEYKRESSLGTSLRDRSTIIGSMSKFGKKLQLSKGNSVAPENMTTNVSELQTESEWSRTKIRRFGNRASHREL